jgi:hypothetical protein
VRGDGLERVQTKEDVYTIFNAKKEIERLQAFLIHGLRHKNPNTLSVSREINRLRSEIHGKYKVLI